MRGVWGEIAAYNPPFTCCVAAVKRPENGSPQTNPELNSTGNMQEQASKELTPIIIIINIRG